MKFAMQLCNKKNGSRVDPRSAFTLAWELLSALADLLHMTRQLNSHNLTPSITNSCVSIAGEVEHAPDFFGSVQGTLECLHLAAELLCSAERLLGGTLCDRLTRPEARLPIDVRHSSDITELLVYHEASDVIYCRTMDWEFVVGANQKILKVLSRIEAHGLTSTLEVDDEVVALPFVSPTLFSHGDGLGKVRNASCCVSGHYQVASEIEVRIGDFRNGKVIRAQLNDAAHETASRRRMPFTAAVRYSETKPLLPLLPAGNGKVTIEKVWAIEEQTELELS